jgi:hypothetical protein
MWEPIVTAGIRRSNRRIPQLKTQKKGAETAPEDVPKEEDENREHALSASTSSVANVMPGWR